jgi:hypothetical protein
MPESTNKPNFESRFNAWLQNQLKSKKQANQMNSSAELFSALKFIVHVRDNPNVKSKEFKEDVKEYTEKLIAPLCQKLHKQSPDDYDVLFQDTDVYKAFKNYEVTVGTKTKTIKNFADSLCSKCSSGFDYTDINHFIEEKNITFLGEVKDSQ